MTKARPTLKASCKDEVFPGPRPFQPEEADLFFGRGREIADLRDLALSYRVLLLYSRSGAGKTSLVNASLLKLLEAAGFTVLRARVAGQLPDWQMPLPKGFNVYAFHALTTMFPDRISAEEAAQGTLATELAPVADSDIKPCDQPSTYVIFDQFEEFFTVHAEHWQERVPFFEQLREALKKNANLHALFVIREDYVANLDPFSDYVPGGFRFRYRLERLRTDQAKKAIRYPLYCRGIHFTPGKLAKEIVRELSKERIRLDPSTAKDINGEFVEPMHLQVVCRSLWQNLPPGTTHITSEDISTYAGVDQTLSDYYDDSVRRAVESARLRRNFAGSLVQFLKTGRTIESRLRRWIELRLITGSGTRAFAYLGDAQNAGLPEVSLRGLAEERLIHIEQRAGADWIELTHDRFIQPIRAANAAWERPRRLRLVIAAGVVGALLLAGILWRVRESANAVTMAQALATKAEQTADTYQTVLAAGGDLPQRLEANSRLDKMDLSACAGVTINFYPLSAPTEAVADSLESVWRHLGFQVNRRNWGIRREEMKRKDTEITQVMNAVFRGSDVHPECWRAVACTLIRAGIPLRRVGPIARDPEKNRTAIEVGYSGAGRKDEPITVNRLWSLQ